ncbi:hypothetical protein B14911_10792 [Bacillus sp. NRRL B-14911]|uniref:hypothetical protein n=1 Tax=Bacillus sp. NRRL B-14911 TaxID=313627 RepID=UPI00006B597C|nr:hypothetical protein [Bacillus sp. NRRL B-14911]EAR66216.1 hypothetical protein B14911_10792 [Bacillus sp. NRRL B-14911]
MNIFQYQGQEEDHYTNILLNILNYKEQLILQPFINKIIPHESTSFQFENASIHIRKKHCPEPSKQYEYVIGVAPYKSALAHSELEDNSGSIPDAWVCGKNFNLLFEFKIRGTLDEGQISAHKKLLTNGEVEVIRISWDQVFHALAAIQTEDEIIKYLIQNFVELKRKFQSKRRSSGMPKAIISNIKKEHELYFTITGSKMSRPYQVRKHYQGKVELLKGDLDGITAARSFIANYIRTYKEDLPINYFGEETVINDYCIAPGRAEKKNQWNQWRLGAFPGV